jgi:hypothetical protein
LRARCLVPSPVFGGVSSPLKYSPPGAFSLATFALDDSAWLWPNARRDRNRFSSLPNNSRHRPAIRSTRSSINSLMRIALTHRYRRTPHANIVTTRVRGMMRASVRQPDGVSATIELTGRRCELFNLFRQCDYSRTPCGLASWATGFFPTSNQNSTRPQHQSNATATFGATRRLLNFLSPVSGAGKPDCANA